MKKEPISEPNLVYGKASKSLIEQCDEAKHIASLMIDVIDQTKIELSAYEVPTISSLRPQHLGKTAFFNPGIIQKPGTEPNYDANAPDTDPPRMIVKSAQEMLFRTALANVEKKHPQLRNQVTFSVGNFNHLRLVLIKSEVGGVKKLPSLPCVLEILRNVSLEIDQLKARLVNNWTFNREANVSFLENKDCIGNIIMMFFSAMTMTESSIFKDAMNMGDLPSTDPLVLDKITWKVKCQLPAAKLLFSHCGVPIPDYTANFNRFVAGEIIALAKIDTQLSNELQKIIDEKLEIKAYYNKVNLFVQKHYKQHSKGLQKIIRALHECKFFMDAERELTQQLDDSSKKSPIF